MDKYSRLEAQILGMGLDNIWLLKPLMNVRTDCTRSANNSPLYVLLCLCTCRETS
jgi:hypothetical protein